MCAYYPIMLQLAGRRCVVVGGGAVAERKIASLLSAGARVTVVSPTFTKQILLWTEQNRLQGIARKYKSTDADNAFLLVAATDQDDVNRQICADASARGQLVNSADGSAGGNFVLPAVVRRGSLVIAVSTSGASPAAAAAIRRDLELHHAPIYEKYIDFLHDIRMELMEIVNDAKQRQKVWGKLLEENLLERFHSEPPESLKESVWRYIFEEVNHADNRGGN